MIHISKNARNNLQIAQLNYDRNSPREDFINEKKYSLMVKIVTTYLFPLAMSIRSEFTNLATEL